MSLDPIAELIRQTEQAIADFQTRMRAVTPEKCHPGEVPGVSQP